MRIGPPILAALLLSGCAPKTVETAPNAAASRRSARISLAARAELERRAGRLELSLIEKEAQVEELQSQLEETRQEVVRAMAKLQTLASRAEAASGMAEAEVALQSLKTDGGQASEPEATQATRMLKVASAEFDQENYGGALYLANQAKALAATGRGRQAADERGRDRPGETAFALPIPLKAAATGNVREGPGTSSPLAFSVEPGDVLIGYSYVDEWIRITDGTGRSGWIFRRLVARQ
jgi:uncharacterized protein YgiM (DUF1202 family)